MSAQGVRGDGGSFVYLFETAEGSLLYQDTSGHWSGILHNLRPDVAILAAAGRGTSDGEPIQGTLAQFMARQADLLRPRRAILDHHDDWLPGFVSRRAMNLAKRGCLNLRTQRGLALIVEDQGSINGGKGFHPKATLTSMECSRQRQGFQPGQRA